MGGIQQRHAKSLGRVRQIPSRSLDNRGADSNASFSEKLREISHLHFWDVAEHGWACGTLEVQAGDKHIVDEQLIVTLRKLLFDPYNMVAYVDGRQPHGDNILHFHCAIELNSFPAQYAGMSAYVNESRHRSLSQLR